MVERVSNLKPNAPPTVTVRFPISANVIPGIAFVIDSIAILGSGLALYFSLIHVNANTIGLYAACVCSIWITTVMLFQFSELYRFEAIVRPLPNLDKIVIAFVTGFLFLLAAAFSVKLSATISRAWMAAFAACAVSLTMLGRVVLWQIVQRLSRQGVFSRSVIIVGSDRHVAELLKRIDQAGAEFVTVTALFVEQSSQATIEGRAIAGDLDAISQFARATRVDDVIIAMPWSAEERILGLVEELRELPVAVYLGSDFIGMRLDFSEPPGHFSNIPIFSVVGHPMSGWRVAIKAAEDYVLALSLLIIFAIPMAIIAILVRLDSPGPVFFKQQRLGFNNRSFWIYKFRTMRATDSIENKTIQAKRIDPRVTRIGRLLRSSSFDELPQLFNVLTGDMSLVGPRPHAVDHNNDYSKSIRGYFSRHKVKPGITGYAQVNGLRGETETSEKMEARIRHDVFYTENWSLIFDLKILLKTPVAIFSRKNAY